MQGAYTNHVGERRVNNEGYEMVVIACRSSDRVMVRFENGTTKDNVKYQHFRNGSVRMPVLDHLGNEFPSRSAMCKYYGVSDNLFKKRIKNGWPLEKALSPPKEQNIEIVDHTGTRHSSLRQAAREYGITEKTLRKRLKSGYSIKEALTIPTDKGNRILDIRLQTYLQDERLSSVERIILVALLSFSDQVPQVPGTVKALSEELPFDQSMIQNILTSLVEKGYVTVSLDSSSYELNGTHQECREKL